MAVTHPEPTKVFLKLSPEAVSIRWTGLGTGLWDWTVGLDCGTGLTESCAN